MMDCEYPGCNEEGEKTFFDLNLCEKHRHLMQFVVKLFRKISSQIEES